MKAQVVVSVLCPFCQQRGLMQHMRNEFSQESGMAVFCENPDCENYGVLFRLPVIELEMVPSEGEEARGE